MNNNLRFVQKVNSSLIDFPPYLSVVVFTPGCVLRCPYCFNKHVVLDNTGISLSPEDILSYIDETNDGSKLIDAVVISGGEPLMFSNELIPFLKALKQRGLFIKIDTTLYGGLIKPILPYIDGVSISIKSDKKSFVMLSEQFRLINYAPIRYKEIRCILTKENKEAVKYNYLTLINNKDIFNSKLWYLHIDKAIKAEDYFAPFTELDQAEIEEEILKWPNKDWFKELI